MSQSRVELILASRNNDFINRFLSLVTTKLSSQANAQYWGLETLIVQFGSVETLTLFLNRFPQWNKPISQLDARSRVVREMSFIEAIRTNKQDIISFYIDNGLCTFENMVPIDNPESILGTFTNLLKAAWKGDDTYFNTLLGFIGKPKFYPLLKSFLSQKDIQGFTAFNYALGAGHKAIVNIILGIVPQSVGDVSKIPHSIIQSRNNNLFPTLINSVIAQGEENPALKAELFTGTTYMESIIHMAMFFSSNPGDVIKSLVESIKDIKIQQIWIDKLKDAALKLNKEEIHRALSPSPYKKPKDKNNHVNDPGSKLRSKINELENAAELQINVYKPILSQYLDVLKNKDKSSAVDYAYACYVALIVGDFETAITLHNSFDNEFYSIKNYTTKLVLALFAEFRPTFYQDATEYLRKNISRLVGPHFIDSIPFFELMMSIDKVNSNKLDFPYLAQFLAVNDFTKFTTNTLEKNSEHQNAFLQEILIRAEVFVFKAFDKERFKNLIFSQDIQVSKSERLMAVKAIIHLYQIFKTIHLLMNHIETNDLLIKKIALDDKRLDFYMNLSKLFETEIKEEIQVAKNEPANSQSNESKMDKSSLIEEGLKQTAADETKKKDVKTSSEANDPNVLAQKRKDKEKKKLKKARRKERKEHEKLEQDQMEIELKAEKNHLKKAKKIERKRMKLVHTPAETEADFQEWIEELSKNKEIPGIKNLKSDQSAAPGIEHRSETPKIDVPSTPNVLPQVQQMMNYLSSAQYYAKTAQNNHSSSARPTALRNIDFFLNPHLYLRYLSLELNPHVKPSQAMLNVPDLRRYTEACSKHKNEIAHEYNSLLESLGRKSTHDILIKGFALKPLLDAKILSWKKMYQCLEQDYDSLYAVQVLLKLAEIRLDISYYMQNQIPLQALRYGYIAAIDLLDRNSIHHFLGQMGYIDDFLIHKIMDPVKEYEDNKRDCGEHYASDLTAWYFYRLGLSNTMFVRKPTEARFKNFFTPNRKNEYFTPGYLIWKELTDTDKKSLACVGINSFSLFSKACERQKTEDAATQLANS